MTELVRSFVMDESGATAIEYGLLAALVSLTIVGAATVMGTDVSNIFTTISSTVVSASSGG